MRAALSAIAACLASGILRAGEAVAKRKRAAFLGAMFVVLVICGNFEGIDEGL